MIHPVPKPGVVKKARQPLRAKKRMKRYNAKRKGHMFPKGVDEARREFVRTFPCCVCALPENYGWPQTGPTLACHLKSRGAGGQDAGNLWPGCDYHHTQQHLWGVKTFEKRHHLSVARVCERIERAYQAGATPTQEHLS